MDGLLQRSNVSFRRQGSSGAVWDEKFSGRLQRSEVSFRRQGSSGAVWGDNYLSGELNNPAGQQRDNISQQLRTADNNPSAAETSATLTIERSRSTSGRGYRAGRVSPALEPPSPRVSACGLCCGAFGNANKTRRRP